MQNNSYVLHVIKALKVSCIPGKASSTTSCKWMLPDRDEVKMCCAGFSTGNPGVTGISICYRNWEGEVLGTSAKAVGSSFKYIFEVQAIIEGVEKAISKGWFRLWIVSVSTAAIKALTSNKIPWIFRLQWERLLSYNICIRLSSIWMETNFSAVFLPREVLELLGFMKNGVLASLIFFSRLKILTLSISELDINDVFSVLIILFSWVLIGFSLVVFCCFGPLSCNFAVCGL
ncbi:hypothetical protein GIB67_039495 [Kingdonia uniflora]|uniref:RNase H type-1 domain-containing protein n=1 Tax=Kingdonia uniflora TaxID=39325 RepID=A0A7J7LIM6_9MAGN|nr:hypothetical protein GIB67_039495 [Kingdonia uniflora]